jgi:hypothetical protein
MRTVCAPYELMKKDLAGITKRLVAGMLVAVAVVGVSALAIHTPSQNSAARSLNNIQTDKATLFYADSVRAVIGSWSRSCREPARVRPRLRI